jgi:hypothetical protein
MNIFYSSFLFSSSKISHFTFSRIRISRNSRFNSIIDISRNSRFNFIIDTSRNSRFDFFILISSSIIRFRFSFSRFSDNILVDNFFIFNFLFTSSFLLFDCSFFFDFAFSFNSLLSRTRVSLSSNSRKKRKSNSEKKKFDSKEDEKFDSKENENLNLRKEKSSRTTQRFSVIDKTQDVLNYMRKLRFSIFDFLQEIVKIKFMHKHQIIRNSQLLRSFVFNFNNVLNLVNWKREEYRKKLNSLFENKYFKN